MKKFICILLTLVIIFTCATAFAAPESGSYTVTVKAETEGTGTVTGGGTYSAGKNAALTATPADGYVFAGWFKENDLENPVSTEAEFTYSLEEDRTFIARDVYKRQAYIRVLWMKSPLPARSTALQNQARRPKAK